MNVKNDNTARPELQDGIIELGAVSTETKGIGVGAEILTNGENPIAGISEE